MWFHVIDALSYSLVLVGLVSAVASLAGGEGGDDIECGGVASVDGELGDALVGADGELAGFAAMDDDGDVASVVRVDFAYEDVGVEAVGGIGDEAVEALG